MPCERALEPRKTHHPESSASANQRDIVVRKDRREEGQQGFLAPVPLSYQNEQSRSK